MGLQLQTPQIHKPYFEAIFINFCSISFHFQQCLNAFTQALKTHDTINKINKINNQQYQHNQQPKIDRCNFWHSLHLANKQGLCGPRFLQEFQFCKLPNILLGTTSWQTSKAIQSFCSKVSSGVPISWTSKHSLGHNTMLQFSNLHSELQGFFRSSNSVNFQTFSWAQWEDS